MTYDIQAQGHLAGRTIICAFLQRIILASTNFGKESLKQMLILAKSHFYKEPFLHMDNFARGNFSSGIFARDNFCRSNFAESKPNSFPIFPHAKMRICLVLSLQKIFCNSTPFKMFLCIESQR